MLKTKVIFYSEREKCPVLDWLKRIPKKAYAKGMVRIERLADIGHELRRPEADYLRDHIYELRWRFQSVNYRILYFFHRRHLVVLTHCLTKEAEVPSKEVDLAIQRKIAFEANPSSHTYLEE